MNISARDPEPPERVTVMTFGSLFAGVGGFDMGFERAGMRCVWQVECDHQANEVRKGHWPNIDHVRDVIGMSRRPKRYGHWLDHYERPEVICGGFPCQDLSVAGKRAGLAGNRSGLWWQMLRIITGMRPRYVLWENVAGLLSSDGGRDFERVIRSLAERGYFGCTRILDAQFFGVPQRRRRVFGVFATGHLAAERCAEILAVANGVSRNPETGRKAGKDVAFTLTSSVGRSREGNRIGNAWNSNYVAGTLGGGSGRRGYCSDAESETFITHSLTANGFDASEDGTGRGTPLTAFTCKDHGADAGELSPTLRSMGHDRSHQNGGGQVAVAYRTSGNCGAWETGSRTDCLNTSTDPNQTVIERQGVRRLTPVECERLMSWPDEWTRWTHDGREVADGPRYRMCGNGVVASVAEWIGRRLMDHACQ